MEISSSSSTSFDLALDDYLHLYHISSSSSIRCFDLALDYLAKFENPYFYWNCDIELLKAEVKLLKIIFLCVRQCRRRRRNHEALLEHDQEGKGNTICESLRPSIICFGIQDLVTRIINDLHPAYLRYEHSCKSDSDIIESVVTRSQKNIMLFLETDIKKSCTRMLLDYYSPGDPQLVMDLISSIFLVLKYLLYQKRKMLVETLRKKLMLLKDLIGFATMRGVEGMQLIDLLTYTAIVAASLISICRFDRDEEQVLNDMEFEISRLIHSKINPFDPQVREIYIHALTASKLQRSSYGLAAKGNKYAVLDFIASITEYLVDLLNSYTSIPYPVKDQMHKLHQAVMFLNILLNEEKEELGDEMMDLIGVGVCDAGIVIFSLSVNEMKEGLSKETNLVLFHLLKVLKHIKAEVAYIYPLTSRSSFGFPRTNELGSMDFFLETLKELVRCDKVDDSIVFPLDTFPLDTIQKVQIDLKCLRSFLEKIKEQHNRNEKLRAFWDRVMEVACKAESIIDSTLAGIKHEYCLDAVAKDINLMKFEAQEINDSITYDGKTKRVTKTLIHMPSHI